jgi:hypothetical protein
MAEGTRTAGVRLVEIIFIALVGIEVLGLVLWLVYYAASLLLGLFL